MGDPAQRMLTAVSPDPGPFAHYIYNNDVGVFLGVWYAIPNALFAYIGTELIGVTGKRCIPL